MSAFGPKQTSLVAPHMSALGDKADMPVATSLRGLQCDGATSSFFSQQSISSGRDRCLRVSHCCALHSGRSAKWGGHQIGYRTSIGSMLTPNDTLGIRKGVQFHNLRCCCAEAKVAL